MKGAQASLMKKRKKSIKKEFIHDKDWQDIYRLEEVINTLIFDVYFGIVTDRYEMYGITALKSKFKIDNEIYEYIISKRKDDYGFSIYNTDPDKYYYNRKMSHDITILNNDFYLYNMYKIIFTTINL